MRQLIVRSLSIALALYLVVAPMGFAWSAHAQTGCTAAVAPGSWTGTFNRLISGQGRDTGDPVHIKDTAFSETVTGNLTLQVACDGKITGSISNETLNLEIKVDMTNTISNKSATISDSVCTGTSRAQVTGGSVGRGAGGMPVFTLDATVTWDAFTCSDPNLQKLYDQSGGSAGYFATFTLTASRATGTTVSGTVWESDDKSYQGAENDLKRLGLTPTITMSWQLNGSSSATATPEPDTPVIVSLDPLYQQYFLLGVHTVLNQYTAVVDWKNGTPGKVTFTLGTETPMEISTQPYAITKDMGDLPGSATLTAVATNGEGTSSAPQTMGIDIVPVPTWAQQLTFTPQLQNGYVEYLALERIPYQPFTKGYVEIDDRIPFFGGPYGFLPFQLNANLKVDSRGQQGLGTITGLGGGAWGKDKQIDLNFDGETRTTLSAIALNFDGGRTEISFPPQTFQKYFGLLDLIPGTSSYYSLPFVGRIIQALNDLASIGGKMTATIGGQGTLGIRNNQLTNTSGQLNLSADVVIDVVRLGFDSAYVSAGGGGRGSLAVNFSPEWGLGGCSVSMYLRATAYAFGYQAEARSQPWGFVCNTAGSTSTGPRLISGLLAAPEASALRVPARDPGWQPEQSVDKITASSGLSTTVLVQGASPNAAPALAVAPNGQEALAWVTEDASRPRPQGNDIRLRLWDGSAWGDPVDVTHDTRPDFNPKVAFDGQGHVVVAWVQNRLDNLSADSTLDDTFLKNMEIAYAVLDARTGSVVGSGQVTNDSVLDFDPHIATAPDGTVWLAWQTSPQLSAIGDAASPNQIHAVAWDGKQWLPVETVTDKLVDTLWWSLAVQDRQNVLVAADTAAATSGNRDVYTYQRGTGGWSARQMTKGGSANLAPRVAFTPDGKPVVAWYGDQSVHGIVGDLSATPTTWFTTTIDSGSALGGGTLVAGSGGQLALAWPAPTPHGPDMLLARYDSASQKWAAPAPVFDGSNQITDVSAAARGDGTLILGLAQVPVTTEHVTVPGDGAFDIPSTASIANLAVAELPSVFSPGETNSANPAGTNSATTSSSTSAGSTPWLLLVIVAVVVAVLLIGGLSLVLVRRSRSKV